LFFHGWRVARGGCSSILEIFFFCVFFFFSSPDPTNLPKFQKIYVYLKPVSPDAGGVERARFVAERINAPLAIIDKRRDDNGAEALNLIGEVAGHTAIIVDDMGDTFGSVVSASKLLEQRGALAVYACVVHGVLSGPALERIASCEILKKVVVTDTVANADKAAQCDKIEILSVAPILAEAINRIHREESVSSLFI
jgi:ribose-phosphate pyrophosphokinase